MVIIISDANLCGNQSNEMTHKQFMYESVNSCVVVCNHIYSIYTQDCKIGPLFPFHMRPKNDDHKKTCI